MGRVVLPSRIVYPASVQYRAEVSEIGDNMVKVTFFVCAQRIGKLVVRVDAIQNTRARHGATETKWLDQ